MIKVFFKSIFSVFFIGMLLLCACNNDTIKNKPIIIDNDELVKYLRTADIDILQSENKIEVIISNSKLIQEETQKKDYKWTNWEPFASYSALIFAKQLNESLKKKSVVITLKSSGQTEEYAYLSKDLKCIERFTDSCISFSKFIGDGEVIKAKSLLGQQITAKDKTTELDRFLSILISQGSVLKSELISFNIVADIAKLYINVYYSSGKAQTYIFTFFLNGEGKIEGIRTF